MSQTRKSTEKQASDLYTTIIDRQLRFLGHSLRRSKDDLVSQYALYTPHHGKTSRGRPKMQYVKYISQLLCDEYEMNSEEIFDAAQDRVNWRCFVEAACRHSPPG